ncbi:sensor histidine kinase [Microlunatus aurantiacus]|uniref:histidine kinase n=1 Tax=Microlunatus aurantiacus TaxID=446786 RepID=A0ABP7DBQ0_9ACTN
MVFAYDGLHTAGVSVAPTWSSATPRPLRLALIQLGVTTGLLGVILIVLVSAASPALLWAFVLNVLVGWLYVAAGLLAWSRRPANRFGFLIVGAGLSILVAGMQPTGFPVLAAISAVTATVPLAVLVHVLHAYPSGRLASRGSRVVVAGGWVTCLVLQLPLYLFAAQPPPYDLLLVADRPDLLALGSLVQAVAGAAVMVATTVVLAHRLRRASRRRRRVLAPLYGYGILVVLSIPISSSLLTAVGLPPDWVFPIQLIAIAGVPVAFTLALLLGGFARTGEIEALGTWLSSADPGRPPLTAALARALGDDSAELVFWVPERAEYVHANGDVAAEPGGDDRGLAEIERHGQRVGAIAYDRTLLADPAPVHAAGRVIAIAVDHERVTAELRASQQELRRSRERIVRAGDNERRRIARDLHDGLQVRLVLLALQAQEIADDPDTPPAVRDAGVALRLGVDGAAAELRALVHAVLPAALIERGLCAATEDLVDHLPVPTTLQMSVAGDDLSPVVESTAYFVVAEALTNALKHARPSSLHVGLTRVGDHLRVEVLDDGIGGAHVRAGSGLGGLTDRVETLGGRLLLISPSDRGTRVVAELPCAS